MSPAPRTTTYVQRALWDIINLRTSIYVLGGALKQIVVSDDVFKTLQAANPWVTENGGPKCCVAGVEVVPESIAQLKGELL